MTIPLLHERFPCARLVQPDRATAPRAEVPDREAGSRGAHDTRLNVVSYHPRRRPIASASHRLPFHCADTAAGGAPYKLIAVPTAMHARADAQDTALRSPAPLNPPTVHADPFQRSTNSASKALVAGKLGESDCGTGARGATRDGIQFRPRPLRIGLLRHRERPAPPVPTLNNRGYPFDAVIAKPCRCIPDGDARAPRAT